MSDFAANNRPLLFVLAGAILAGIFHYFFAWHVPGVSVGLFVLLIGLSLFSLSRAFGRRLSGDVVSLLLLALFFSGMVAVRASPQLIVFNIGATLLLLAVITEVNARGSIREFFLWDYVRLLRLPFAYLFSLVSTVTSVRLPFSGEDTSRQVIRGLLIAIPVIVVFTLLFAQADPTFHRLLTAFGDFSVADNAILIIVAFVFLCGALSFSFAAPKRVSTAFAFPEVKLGRIETAILLGSVNALFLSFILLQATYLFGGLSNITEGGFTFAEYARRGFFELIAISAFTYLILFAAEKLIGKDADRHARSFRVLSAALVLQTFVLMAFASNRLSLYEAAYGFTVERLYSHAFIVLLFAVFLVLAWKIFIDARENTFLLRTFSAAILFWIGMNLLNPDLFVAEKNLERYAATGKLDYEYLTELSADAAPILLRAFEEGGDPDRAPLGRALYERSLAKPPSWQSWNWSRENARRMLSGSQASFSPYKDYEKIAEGDVRAE